MKPEDGMREGLPSWSAQEIFDAEIIPAIGANGPPVDNPTFTVVSGQTGAGKSTMIRQIRSQFAGQATQVIIADDLNTYIPGNNAALLEGSHSLAETDRSAVAEWCDQLANRSISNRVNIILESCFPPKHYSRLLERARSSGYRTELNIIATDRTTSFTAIHDRFDKALASRFVASTVLPDAETHEHYYSLWPRVAFEVERHKLFDQISVVRRDGSTVFENEQIVDSHGRSNWRHKPGAMRALMIARNRPMDVNQRQWIKDVWNRVENSRAFAQHPDSARVPVRTYWTKVMEALNEDGDLDRQPTRSVFLRAYSHKLLLNLQRDVALISANRSNPRDFREVNFEEAFLKELENQRLTMMADITESFEKRILEQTGAGPSHTAQSPSHTAQSSELRHSSAEKETLFNEDSHIVKRLRTGHEGASTSTYPEDRQAQQQKPQRPKLLVEVSEGVYRPIEDYNRMVRDRDKYPHINRNRSKMNVLIRLEDGNGYETPALLKARSERNKGALFTRTMSEGQLPHSLASHPPAALPAVLVDGGNGRTFLAGERISMGEPTGQIPQSISSDRILVRNEWGGYDELNQRLAARTFSSLPTAPKAQLGEKRILEQTGVGPSHTAQSSELRPSSAEKETLFNEDSHIVKRLRTGHEGASTSTYPGDRQAQQQKPRRPKLLVEVSQDVYRPIEPVRRDEVFPEEDFAAGADGLRANPAGRGQGTQRVWSPSEAKSDDFPEFTEEDLARIDALSETRSTSKRDVVPDIHP
ncbi:zeta toxin family protein, partial [Mesorhizobium sp. M1409]|uniref:zeta toxin family protein n=1 Tax=Mesorhizobium sp. M1409 TaxID=2957100 RepID=UPI003339581D